MNPTVSFILISLLKIVGIVFVVILPMVSYAVYAERKVSALIQDRLGPNRVGPAGLFQPIADAMKFLFKEDFTPAQVNKFYYWLAPCLAMVPAITTIAVVPFGSTLLGVPMVIADINDGILYVYAIISIAVYGIVPAGWVSHSQYPFLGGWHLPLPSCHGGLHWLVVDGTAPGWRGVVGGLFNIATFFAKVATLLFMFMWVRWTLPRFRYDQLMRLGWLFFFEIALVNIFIVAGILAYFQF